MSLAADATVEPALRRNSPILVAATRVPGESDVYAERPLLRMCFSASGMLAMSINSARAFWRSTVQGNGLPQ